MSNEDTVKTLIILSCSLSVGASGNVNKYRWDCVQWDCLHRHRKGIALYDRGGREEVSPLTRERGCFLSD